MGCFERFSVVTLSDQKWEAKIGCMRDEGKTSVELTGNPETGMQYWTQIGCNTRLYD